MGKTKEYIIQMRNNGVDVLHPTYSVDDYDYDYHLMRERLEYENKKEIKSNRNEIKTTKYLGFEG